MKDVENEEKTEKEWQMYGGEILIIFTNEMEIWVSEVSTQRGFCEVLFQRCENLFYSFGF